MNRNGFFRSSFTQNSNLPRSSFGKRLGAAQSAAESELMAAIEYWRNAPHEDGAAKRTWVVSAARHSHLTPANSLGAVKSRCYASDVRSTAVGAKTGAKQLH